MKILAITSSGYLEGGVETGLKEIKTLFKQYGHDIKILSSDYGPKQDRFNDYSYKTIPAKGIGKLVNSAFNVSAYKVTRELVKTFKPDIIVLHVAIQPTAAVLMACKNVPIVAVTHGPEIYIPQFLPWCLNKNEYRAKDYDVNNMTLSGKTKYFYLKYICGTVYKLLLNRVILFVGLSSYTKKILDENNLNAIKIANGVRLNRRAAYNSKSRIIAYAGRLEKFKGVDILIRAMPEVLRHYPETRLIIAGNGSFHNDLKDLTKKLNLKQHVEFYGHIELNSVEKLYIKSNVVVMPSIGAETFGKAGVEALSVGRPVIATRIGGIADWLSDGVNGYLVEPNDSTALSNAIKKIFDKPEKSMQMSDNAFHSAQKFSIENYALSLIDTYKSLLVKSSETD